jgi:hypothetical protein
VSALPESEEEFSTFPLSGEVPNLGTEQVAVNLIHAHSWEMEDTDSFTAQAWTSALGRLRRMLPQVSKKMLAQHLREMGRDRLVVQKNLSSRVLHVEYSVSESEWLCDGASRQHVAGLEQRPLALQDERVNWSSTSRMERECHGN